MSEININDLSDNIIKKKKNYDMNNKNKERYKILKQIDIECPICNKELNLYVINRHINCSKKCSIYQKLKFNDENELKNKKKLIKEQLNMIRFKIKNNMSL